ncbi:MAG: hypothetical protein DRJ68_00530 [Thermoprotei archaeon]|nr:MAG: hypothetical protein DRJ62_02460 [Thermoprotei archaeon]RLF23076.1 MAG: hypothetical protein DRJ68_00530 [Thermoprotei archaeon]
MDFCPKCEGLLKPVRKDGKVYLVCKRCGYTKPLSSSSSGYSATRVIEESKHRTIGVVEEKEELKEKVREEVKEVSQERVRDLMDLLNREQDQMEAEE